MARVIQAWICPDVTEEELIAVCRDVLEEAGFQKVTRRSSRGDMVVSGIYGHYLKAMLVRMLPFGACMRSGNRYKAELKVGSFKERTRLRMEVYPIIESEDSRETLIVSQGIDEAAADSMHSGKFRRTLARALEARVGTMEILDIRARIKRRKKRS